MRAPESLAPLVDNGVIQEVVRPLLAGKEAQIYLVIAGGEERVAKVYKEAGRRSFKHRAEYTEGRNVRNSRDQRAMESGSRWGKARQESHWRTTEVDVIYKLRAAGVRVPQPFDFADGVLVMELVTAAGGHPAPRLADFRLDADGAAATFDLLLREAVKMLCAGVVHGDLSEFNILVGAAGPVVIDFPQAVDPAHNPHARRLLVRDVGNLTRFFGRLVPRLRGRLYGEEMWELYEKRQLTPTTDLTGEWRPSAQRTDTRSLLDEIAAMERESRLRREALGLPMRPARQPRPADPVPVALPPERSGRGRRRGSRGAGPSHPQPPRPAPAPRGARAPEPRPHQPPAAGAGAGGPSGPRRRRRRRRGKRGPGAPPA